MIHQHNICKLDNKERLRDVNNLQDLVKFKVRTVADQLIENNKRQLQKIQSIPLDDEFSRNRLEVLKLEQIQTQNSINTIKHICDPMLAHRNYPQLLTKKGLNPHKNNLCSDNNFNLFGSSNLDI